MANDAEHLPIGLFAICISSAMKCVFMSFAHFSNLDESYLCILSTSYLLDISPWSVAFFFLHPPTPLSWAFTEQALNFDV